MTDLTKAIELAEKASEQLQKSHVKQYTRSDGTVVQEHDDSRHPNIIGKIAYHKIIGKEGRGEQKGNGDPTHHATTSIGHNGKEYTPTGKTGNSMHDGREVHEFESEDGHRVWADKRGNVHADSKSEADQYHKRGRFTEDDDSRQKKSVPPQADSNRHKWADLHDDENPQFALQGSHLTSKTLGKIAKGKIDLQNRAKQELAARGVDEHGKWLGFDKAAKHHGVKVEQQDDDLDGQLQTQHHKVLGAIAAGHTDGKRLAREQLAGRGHDHEGNWIGFDKAAKLHKVD